MEKTSTKVLFCCLGNICRSPTAHGVFEHLVASRGLSGEIVVDSCGTGVWHAGHAPDKRACAEAAGRGYDISALRARQVSAEDFEEFDYILAMDRQNLADLQAQCPDHFRGHLGLFLEYTPMAGAEVPDPYYGDGAGFTQVLDLVEAASEGLLTEITRARSSH